jgi:hypothetical protein
MAVTESFIWLIQPKCAATSPMTAVKMPIPAIEPKNAGQPFNFPG